MAILKATRPHQEIFRSSSPRARELPTAGLRGPLGLPGRCAARPQIYRPRSAHLCRAAASAA